MQSVAKDFHRLMKRIGRLTDGQASIDEVDWDEGTLQKFGLDISPNAGYYKGGKFKFTIHLPDDFPSDRPPVVWCETDIYHPNIDTTETNFDEEMDTNVCLNLLDHGTWRPSYGLEGLVLGLVFLMHHPNTNDPLSPYFDGYVEEEEYAANVKKYMSGNEVDGVTFKVDFCVKEQNENLSKEVGENETESNSDGDSKVNETGGDTVQSKEVDTLKDTVENSDGDIKRIEPSTHGDDAIIEAVDIITDTKEDTKIVTESYTPESSENFNTVDELHRNTAQFDVSVKLDNCEHSDEINNTRLVENTEINSNKVIEGDHGHVTGVDENCECDKLENAQENKEIHEVLPGQSKENESDSDKLSVGEQIQKLNNDENEQIGQIQVHEKTDVAHILLDELINGLVNSDSSDDTDDEELGVKMVYIDGECLLLTEKEYEGEVEKCENAETASDVDCDEDNKENSDAENQDGTDTDNGYGDMNDRSENCKVLDDDDNDGAKCNTELCDTTGASKYLQNLLVTVVRLMFISLKLHYESL